MPRMIRFWTLPHWWLRRFKLKIPILCWSSGSNWHCHTKACLMQSYYLWLTTQKDLCFRKWGCQWWDFSSFLLQFVLCYYCSQHRSLRTNPVIWEGQRNKYSNQFMGLHVSSILKHYHPNNRLPAKITPPKQSPQYLDDSGWLLFTHSMHPQAHDILPQLEDSKPETWAAN